MPDTKDSPKASTQDSRTPGCHCGCIDSEAISKMMQQCCGAEKADLDCAAIMRKMCGGTPKQPDKQG